MALSFVYLAFVSLLRLLMGCGRNVDVKDIELLVLRHQLEILRRQVERPKLRPSDRALLAAAGRLLAPARRHGVLVTPQTLLRWHRELVRRRMDIRAREARAPLDRRQNARACAAAGAREPALGLPAGRRRAQQVVKGANTRFRHAAARWYACRRPPSRSRRWSCWTAVSGDGGVGGWVATGGQRPSARCGRSVLWWST
jgi:hypothetical protein